MLFEQLFILAQSDSAGRICSESLFQREEFFDKIRERYKVAPVDNSPNETATKTVVVLVGLPGSGKSTIAKDIASNLSVFGKIFSTDETLVRIAKEKFGIVDNYGLAFKTVSESGIKWVEQVQREMLESDEQFIIYDATNLVADKRKQLVKRIKDKNPKCFVGCTLVLRNWEKMKESRNLESGKYISPEVYKRMFTSFSAPCKGDGFDDVSIMLVN